MIVDVPKEIKDHEYRIALTPDGASRLVAEGHRVLVQRGGGVASGHSDTSYETAGAVIVEDAESVFSAADLVLKVKEPMAREYPLFRPGLLLFTYLHLAAVPELAAAPRERRVSSIAYETVRGADGSLPLLRPMSQVAGRLSVQAGAHHMERRQGGRGVLMSGVPGVAPARVMVLGSGVVGTNAASVALGMGASVRVLARDIDRLRYLEEVLHGRLETAVSTPESVAASVREADLVIGAVLVPGARAPKLVTREMVRAMQPGSVIVDVAVDQGGCTETTRPTTQSDPAYVEEGVIHYCVTNMPGAVPRTSTRAPCNATLPYVVRLAGEGLDTVRRDPLLAEGLNTHDGHVTNATVARALGVQATAVEDALGG